MPHRNDDEELRYAGPENELVRLNEAIAEIKRRAWEQAALAAAGMPPSEPGDAA